MIKTILGWLAVAGLVVVACYWWTITPATAAQLCGEASWYGTESGTKTANGEHFNGTGLTAAHRSLPFGTKLLVTVVDPRPKYRSIRGNTVTVRINDRGPAKWTGRVLDLAKAAGRHLGLIPFGHARVCATVQ